MNTTTPPSLLLATILLLCLSNQSYSQQITAWQSIYQPNNSYYDIAQVGSDEFWAGGENGTLYSVNSKGELSEMPFPDKQVNILKILPVGQSVYLATDQGRIFHYDKRSQHFKSRYFGKKYHRLCFYDMMLMEDGSLLVVGGHNKIAKGEKTLPLGFIARISPDLEGKPEIVWQNPFTFIWSVTYMPESDEIVAASFNGLNTHLLSSKDAGQTFRKKHKIKGLVHHLQSWNNELWYSGTKNIYFSKKGMVGRLNHQQQLTDGGCIWSLVPINDRLVGLNYSGELVFTDTHANKVGTVKATTYSLYEGVSLSSNKALAIGHGRRLYLIDLNQPGLTCTLSADLSQVKE